MSFTPNFLRILVLVMCAVFVLCAQILGNLNEISKLGNCLDYDLRRSPLMVKEVIQKPNNQSNTVLFENDELRWTVRYPAQGYFGSPIRCILIKDNARDGSDGYATVQSGGVNQRQVVIYFKSHHSRDIDFNIEIYGDARHWWILFGKTEFET